MEAQGVPSPQLVPVSWGEVHPVADNGTPEGRAENRRIEIRLRPVIRE
jgi:outer membrane protein OmpA-like peptidoglycan-associated protein